MDTKNKILSKSKKSLEAESIDELERFNKKRQLQNKVLKKMVEHLNEQEKGITGKPKKK